MLSDYVTIDFDAIREKVIDGVFAVAGQVANTLEDVFDAAESAFYNEQGGATVNLDFETFDPSKPFEVPASIEPWLRTVK